MWRSLSCTVVLTLAGCSDVYTETYATWQEAKDAGAVQRGWIGSFVPTSAVDIKETHNIDTNVQTLLFAVPPSQVPAMVRGMRTLAKTDMTIHPLLVDDLRLDMNDWEPFDRYIVCDEGNLGFLFVHSATGRSAYFNVQWEAARKVEEICSI
jgi:hypothetical protein